jgi:branched-chain amino acid transport system ATP-binding protein
LGANGAGKTTTLRGCAGLIQPSKGQLSVLGDDSNRPLHHRARCGLALLPEERAIVPGLSAMENLRLAGADVERVLEIFPELGRLLQRRAGLLSGGEQQMLVLARIIACRPKLILADELSLGLAPQVVSRLLTAMRSFADGGGGVLLVEQQIHNALSIADHGYVMSRGRIVMEGLSSDLRGRVADIEASYL